MVSAAKNASGMFRSLLLALSLCLSVAIPEAESSTARQLVDTAALSLKTHTDQLVQQVQAFLQASGRWSPSPQGQDMQLCQALQSFQKKVGKLNSDNHGASYTTVRTDLQELEFQTQMVAPLLTQVGVNAAVQSAWMQCRSDILSVSQALSMVPSTNSDMFYDAVAGAAPGLAGSFPPAVTPGFPQAYPPTLNPNVANSALSMFSQAAPTSPFYPGLGQTNVHITQNSTFDTSPGFQGDYSFGGPYNQFPQNNSTHYSSQIYSNLSGAENQTERFVKQLSTYLQMKSQWPPSQGSAELLLCQHLQTFQIQLRKFRGDLQSNLAYPTLQSELQQIGASSQSIDQLLMEISAPQDIVSRWNEVRTLMNSTYQSFLSAGSSGYIWMR